MQEVKAYIMNRRPSWTPSLISADVFLVLPHKWIYWIPCPQKHMVRHQSYHHWSKIQEVIASIRNWPPSWRHLEFDPFPEVKKSVTIHFRIPHEKLV